LLGNNALLGTGSFIYEFLNSRLQANIEFLEQNNRVQVLSNPMVLASNHREAELFIGEESLLTRGFTFNPPVITNNTVVSPAFVETETELEEIGITLRITPRINSDDTVTLELEQENSTLNPGGATVPISDGTGNVVNLPIDTVNNARLTGTVLAKDGLTVAVGGLIRTSKSRNEQKVPLLGEIPVIGRVFRSTTETEEETETVLLITPHIIERPEQSESIRQAENKFYKSHNAGDPEPVLPPNKFLDGPGATQSKSFIAPDSRLPSKANSTGSHSISRQELYLEMSQYAAEMMRIPEIERVRDKVYEPTRVRKAPAALFSAKQLDAEPVASWKRGGVYVTALSVENNAPVEAKLDYKNIRGAWLASSVEQDVLAASGRENSATYLYLISAFPFEEAVASVR
jgi:general secretion pathway protein D